MNSTDYLVDRRELQFVILESLKVGELCDLPKFEEFDEEMFKMIINEASTFSEKILGPTNQR